MANGITINNRTVKSISSLAITRLDDGVIFNWAKPTSFNLNEGIEQREQEGKNDVGETVRINTFPRTRKPTLVIGYQTVNPEMIAWKMGNRLEKGTYKTRFPIQTWVTQAEFPGTTSGNRGFGIPQDVGLGEVNGPRGSGTEGELSVILTQAAWDDYDTWRTDPYKFAVGQNLGLRFSDNIVNQQQVVTLSIPVTAQFTRISDMLLGAHRIEALVVDSLNNVHYIEVYQATPDLSNAALDFSADTIELNFFLNSPPGFCRAWNLFSPTENNQVACVAA